MATDKRIKGCPNVTCERHQKKIKLKSTEEFCPKCGARLIFVCSKCFRQIEDIDSKHRICELCDAQEREKREAALDKAKKAGKVAAGVVTPVVIGIARNVTKDMQKEGINKGSKIVKTVIKTVIKK